jgi:hypothetical protein
MMPIIDQYNCPIGITKMNGFKVISVTELWEVFTLFTHIIW